MGSEREHGERIERLEEAQMFAEHKADQFAQQLAALERALRALAGRLDGVERGMDRVGDRVRRLGEGLDAGERPPESGSGEQ